MGSWNAAALEHAKAATMRPMHIGDGAIVRRVVSVGVTF
jgi:hypothetical protein